MLTINNTTNGEVGELKLVGRLDVTGAKAAEPAFVEAAAASRDIVLDMTELDYIASAGLRVMKRLRKMVRDNGGSLTLRGVQDDVMDVFELTGFAAMLNFE